MALVRKKELLKLQAQKALPPRALEWATVLAPLQLDLLELSNLKPLQTELPIAVLWSPRAQRPLALMPRLLLDLTQQLELLEPRR